MMNGRQRFGITGYIPIMNYEYKDYRREWVVDSALQLVAYAEAHNEIYGTEIPKFDSLEQDFPV